MSDRTASDEGPGRRRYHREALLAVLRILGTVGEDVAEVFATIVKLRADHCDDAGCRLSLDAMAEKLGLDTSALRRRLLDVDDRFVIAFGINLLDPRWRRRRRYRPRQAEMPDARAHQHGRR